MKISPLRAIAAGALSLALVTGQGAAFGLPPRNGGSTQPSVTENITSGAPLRDLIVDQLGTIRQGNSRDSPALGFTPHVTDYSATAYHHRKSVTIYPLGSANASISVKVGDRALAADSDGRYLVDLKEGQNIVKITAAKSGKTKTYTLTINKVNTDFRGNELVTGLKASSHRTSAPGGEINNILDADTSTVWFDAEAPVAATNPHTTESTGFTLELPEVRDIVRLNVYGNTVPNRMWYPNEFTTNATISVSLDGKSWTTVMERAALRGDQGLLYWDLEGPHQAKYVRVSLANLHTPSSSEPALEQWRINTLELWARPIGAEPQSRPEANAQSIKERCSDEKTAKYGDVNRAQKLALCQGLLFPTWMPSENMAHDVPTHEENQILGGLSPMFYDQPMFNSYLMEQLPKNTAWGIAKAPSGGNGIGTTGEPAPFLTDDMLPYVDNLHDLQYGDEGHYSAEEVESFRKWFEFSKQQYPYAIAHSNQNDNPGWGDLESFRTYVKTAKPDLASWDTYYWGGGGAFGTHEYAPANQTAGILNVRMWQTQRQASLEGITGDGSEPIIYGQYLDMFDFNGSESQKALITNLGLTTGQKYLAFFRVEYNAFDGGALVDEDGAPLRGAYEYGDVVTRAKNLSPYLMPLNNEWVATVPGQKLKNGTPVNHPVATGYKMESFANSEAANNEFGLKNVTAENIGTTNDGLPGDVVLGYFNTLPRLSGDYAEDVFGTATPKGIMVTNGLTGHTEHGQNGERPATMPYNTRYDDGQHWQAAQRVTLELTESANSTLRSVDPSTGEVSTVTPIEKNGRHYVSLTLGGGQSAFLYWDEAPIFANVLLDTDTIYPGKTVQATVTITNPTRKALKNFRIKNPEVPGLILTRTSGIPKKIPAGESIDISYELTASPGVQGSMLQFDMSWNGGQAQATAQLGGRCGPRYTPTALAADSEELDREPAGFKNATDGDTSTIWHTQWGVQPAPGFGENGHWIVVEAPEEAAAQENSIICGINITPRQNAASERAKDYAVFASDDGKNWGTNPIAEGTLLNIGETQEIPLPNVESRYLKFVAWNNHASGSGTEFLAISEISLTIGARSSETTDEENPNRGKGNNNGSDRGDDRRSNRGKERGRGKDQRADSTKDQSRPTSPGKGKGKAKGRGKG